MHDLRADAERCERVFEHVRAGGVVGDLGLRRIEEREIGQMINDLSVHHGRGRFVFALRRIVVFVLVLFLVEFLLVVELGLLVDIVLVEGFVFFVFVLDDDRGRGRRHESLDRNEIEGPRLLLITAR
jgi:hypothetical protein